MTIWPNSPSPIWRHSWRFEQTPSSLKRHKIFERSQSCLNGSLFYYSHTVLSINLLHVIILLCLLSRYLMSFINRAPYYQSFKTPWIDHKNLMFLPFSSKSWTSRAGTFSYGRLPNVRISHIVTPIKKQKWKAYYAGKNLL